MISNDDFTAFLDATRSNLSLRQIEALRLMANPEDDGDGLFVYEKGVGYVDMERFGFVTLRALLRACLIRHIDGEPGGFEVYEINEDGRRLVSDLAPPTPPHHQHNHD